ncbi:MAG: hypothetical protein ACI4RD_05060 [Kiritimatiellia bacterium]
MKRVAFALFATTAAAVFAGDFKVGFSRVDITPPLGVYMPGYYRLRYARQVLDPLQINMVAFSDGAKTALVAQYDTEALSDSVADDMRAAIVRATGVDRDAILLHASHTHDGGFLARQASNGASADMKTGSPAGDGVISKTGPLDELYVAMAVSRSADAAVEAIRDLRAAKLSYQRSVARRITFGRRWRMRDGSVRTNPGTNHPDAVEPVDTADETVQVLRIDREGAKSICVINFQTHPDVVGGETLTADWPGLTRRVFEAATFGETRCMVLNGTQGDVNHCNVKPLPGELNGLTRDFDDVDRGYDHARHMANVLASAALGVWMKCIPLAAGEVRFATANVRVPAQKAKDTDRKNLAWAERVWKLHESGQDEQISKELGCTGMGLTTEVARAGRIRRMASAPDFHELPLTSVSIGRSVAFGGFPGEPFNDIGVQVRKASPFVLTMLSCLTNGSRGYFPFAKAYREDGYESATSPFGPTVADDLVKGEIELLNRLCR